MEDRDSANERRREEIRQENAGLLDEFAAFLEEEDIGRKAIDLHLVNVDLFVNQCLRNRDVPAAAAEGPTGVAFFLSDWLPRNAMWIDADAVRRHADSVRRFYDFMRRTGRIDDAAYEGLVKKIRSGLSQWIAVAENDDEPMADEGDGTDADRAPELRVRRARPKAPRDPRSGPRGGTSRRRPERSGQAPLE